MDRYEIYSKAIGKYGLENQKDMVIEEMSELTKAILKERRAIKEQNKEMIEITSEFVAEETADVEIMLEQLKMMEQNEDLVDWYKTHKLERLEERLKEATNENIS